MSPSLINPIPVVGHDPSLRNWGVASGLYYPDTERIEINYLGLVNPVLSKGKQVRQNSLDMESAHQLYKQALIASFGATAVFAEVPVGSQSARSMVSCALCIGVLGSLRASGVPLFEQTPQEVKLASVGKKTATKREMIEWAMTRYPHLDWPTYTQHGKQMLTEGKAEHMADAIATIHAGIASTPFQQMLKFLPIQTKDCYADSTQAT